MRNKIKHTLFEHFIHYVKPTSKPVFMMMNLKCKVEIALQIFYVFNRAILVADMHVKHFDLVFYMHILVAWISKHY